METLELFSPPLGARLYRSAAQRHLDLQAGDELLLYTDGVYESRNASGEPLGIERLVAAVASTSLTSRAAELREMVFRTVAEFAGGAIQEDDVTVVVVKLR